MNRRSLFSTLLLSTLPVVACSWMLLPRGYRDFFGPSLLDTMLTPSWTTVPSTTTPSLLLRQWMDETTRAMAPLLPSVPYEYLNHEANVTIRLTLPAGMTTDQVQVQFDEEHSVLTIRGKQEEEEEEEVTPSEGAEVDAASALTTPRSRRVLQFSQSFALDPDRMQLDHVTAEFSNDGQQVLTITVPKVVVKEEALPSHIRSIPIRPAVNDDAVANGATTPESVVEEAAVH